MHPTGIQLENMCAVIKALREGKEIQARRFPNAMLAKPTWHTKVSFITWQPGEFEYRVKPEPREVWVNIITGSYFSFSTKEQAQERVQPAITYDGIAVHFKEVVEDGVE